MTMTPADELHKIRSLRHEGKFVLSLVWLDGSETRVDLSSVVGAGVFSTLADLEAFKTVRVGERGAWIEWPNPIYPGDEPVAEIDAEALYELGTKQHRKIGAKHGGSGHASRDHGKSD